MAFVYLVRISSPSPAAAEASAVAVLAGVRGEVDPDLAAVERVLVHLERLHQRVAVGEVGVAEALQSPGLGIAVSRQPHTRDLHRRAHKVTMKFIFIV